MIQKLFSEYSASIKKFVFGDKELKGKNIIYAGGMMRSGSTLLYNIIRLIMQKKYETNFAAGWIVDMQDFTNFDNYLIKNHSLERKHFYHSSIVFFSYRDVRACLYSYSIKFNEVPTYDFCKQQIKQYEFAKKKGAILFSYESLLYDTKTQITKIAEILNVEVDEQEIFSKIPAITYNDDAVFGYDKLTLLHNNHSSRMKEDEWKEALDKSLLQKIEIDFNLWFKETGYGL